MIAKRRKARSGGEPAVNALLDSVNVRLLRELLKDPRTSMTTLARRVRMSAPAVTERVRRLEESGVIVGYRVDLDPKALGLPVIAYVRVRPMPSQLPKVVDLATQMPEVVECHRITGEDCFLLKVHACNMEHVERILDRFIVFGQTTTSILQSSPVLLRALPLPPTD